jgi:hypothetical protein
MKIRTGFVSNSSSSSFCICGINKKHYKIKKSIEADYLLAEAKNELVEFFEKHGLSFVEDDDGDSFVGLPINEVFKMSNNNLTLKELKEDIRKKLSAVFMGNLSINVYHGTLYI